MVLSLFRTYHPNGVNGDLYCNGDLVCHTIELPWLNNMPDRSCIPEGTYVLKKRWSVKHKWHLIVTGVQGRSFILIHPANNAVVELKGCIAPVTQLTGVAKGILSRIAMQKVLDLAYTVISTETVFLIISKTK